MKTKVCLKCKKEKSISEFSFRSVSKDGIHYYCRECQNKKTYQYLHTKLGLISRIYSHQKNASKKRKHPMPTYSKQELKDWLFSQKKFHELFDNWKTSGFKKDSAPSVDRLDDYKGYSLSNIQLMTWRENSQKSYISRINGTNNKASKTILQYTLNGVFVKEYYSTMHAERETGLFHSSIIKACKGKNKTSGGFLWKYKD